MVAFKFLALAVGVSLLTIADVSGGGINGFKRIYKLCEDPPEDGEALDPDGGVVESSAPPPGRDENDDTLPTGRRGRRGWRPRFSDTDGWGQVRRFRGHRRRIPWHGRRWCKPSTTSPADTSSSAFPDDNNASGGNDSGGTPSPADGSSPAE